MKGDRCVQNRPQDRPVGRESPEGYRMLKISIALFGFALVALAISAGGLVLLPGIVAQSLFAVAIIMVLLSVIN
jgi:hypothetical protein